VEFVDWLSWFALLPMGGMLVFGVIVYFWARTVVLTRRRAWVITVSLSLFFFIVAMVIIYKLAYLMPE